MSKIRNTGISSLYLVQLVNEQHKNLKTFAVLVYGHVYIICDVPHRHPTYVGALDFELWPCFVKIIFFG